MAVSIEEYQAMVGSELGVSDWIVVDQAKIDAFAEVTGDHQFIHVDPVAAAQTPFGGTIAHGMLTLSMAIAMLPPRYLLIEGLVMAVNYGFEKVRLIAPVPSGSEIRARHKFLGATPRGSGWLLRNEITVEIRGIEKPALTAESLILQLTA
jgi:acyl dehydratase